MGYLTVVFLVLSPVRAVVFMIVQQSLFGLYLGCSFAPSHKGMPILDAADQCDFLRRQAITSRNVRGGWLTDVALGGLNYQIEHHLFPSMPRPSLRRYQALIEAFCRQRGVPYCRSSLVGSYSQALRHLHAVGRPARPAAAAGAAARGRRSRPSARAGGAGEAIVSLSSSRAGPGGGLGWLPRTISGRWSSTCRCAGHGFALPYASHVTGATLDVAGGLSTRPARKGRPVIG